jgi:hypothetical protein
MSGTVVAAELPAGALLERYRTAGGHVDCFIADLDRVVTLPQLISAFYTSAAFRPERWILGVLVGKPGDDQDAARLASGEVQRFSVWTVEDRREDQILLADYQGKTRSWLMVRTQGNRTRIHFGSAVVPAKLRSDRILFASLLGFHKLYSRVLLNGAIRRL